MKRLPVGRAVALLLLLALGAASYSSRAPNLRRRHFPVNSRRVAGCFVLRQSDHVERLSQTGHPSVRAVLTALLEDRLYFRNSDQKVFIVKAADADPLNLIDPLIAQGRRIRRRRRSDRDRNQQRVAGGGPGRRGALLAFEPGCIRAAGRGAGNVEVARRPDRSAAARTARRWKQIPASGRKSPPDWRWPLLDGGDPAARLAAIATLKGSVSQDVRNRRGGPAG